MNTHPWLCAGLSPGNGRFSCFCIPEKRIPSGPDRFMAAAAAGYPCVFL